MSYTSIGEDTLPDQDEVRGVTVMDGLKSFGGFGFLSSVVTGVQNMDPSRKARKSIFLHEEAKQKERTMLRNELQAWINLLTAAKSVSEMIDESSARWKELEEILKKNLLKQLNAVRNLEQAYRSVQLFYSNTRAEVLKNITIVNGGLEQLKDLDSPVFIDHIAGELKQNFDRLDLRNNYSLLVIPGYLGSAKVVEKWANIAHQNKVMLITDFAHFDRPDDVMDMFAGANLTGGDIYRSNVCMTCNWIVGRRRMKEVNEQEDLFVPPASSLAGRVYSNLMSQVTAGKKHGGIADVDAVAFDLRKSEVSQLEQMGLIPMVFEYGKVMAFSAKTLFNGDNLGLQTYSVVRVFDYIAKVMFDFLNRRAFENWNSRMEQDLKGQIMKFLNGIQGGDRLIEGFNVMRFEQDEIQKDRIYLDIHITPFFPARSFIMRLDGYKGEDEATTWASVCEPV